MKYTQGSAVSGANRKLTADSFAGNWWGPMSSMVLAILYAVHLLATVLWVGGLVTLAVVVRPGTRRVLSDAPDPQEPVKTSVDALLSELERRFTPLANLSLVVLIATGMLQMSVDENYSGFLQFDNTWAWAMALKHVAVLGMAVMAGYTALVLEPERRRLGILATAKRPDEKAHQQLARRRARLAMLNLGCGFLTLLFTAVATAQ